MRSRTRLAAAVAAVAVVGLLGAGTLDAGSAAPGASAQGLARPHGALKAAAMRLGPALAHPAARMTVPRGYAIATSGPTVARPAGQPASAVNAASSLNWAGMYSTQPYTGAYGSWVQPKIAKLASNHFGSTWVGVDGFSNSDLIQTGSEADNYKGTRIYRAWWEILPDAETVIYVGGKPAPVSAGDRFKGEVKQVGVGTWSISLQDTTKKWAFYTTKAYDGPGTSAEFIEEASQYGGEIGTPPHFGEVTFSSLELQKAGTWHDTHFTSNNEIKLIQHSHTYAYPSAPSSGQPQSFHIYYKAP